MRRRSRNSKPIDLSNIDLSKEPPEILLQILALAVHAIGDGRDVLVEDTHRR
jgi:hypothetical protein